MVRFSCHASDEYANLISIRIISPHYSLRYEYTHEVTNNCTTTINYNDTIETVDEAYVTNYVVITKLFTFLADDRYAIIL